MCLFGSSSKFVPESISGGIPFLFLYLLPFALSGNDLAANLFAEFFGLIFTLAVFVSNYSPIYSSTKKKKVLAFFVET